MTSGHYFIANSRGYLIDDRRQQSMNYYLRKCESAFKCSSSWTLEFQLELATLMFTIPLPIPLGGCKLTRVRGRIITQGIIKTPVRTPVDA
jgi:hypothetical protein